MILRQSTAVVLSFGPFLDRTDGVTPETGLVSALDHASTGILLSKNGGALTIRHASVTASSYDAYGNYIVTLDTTDTNTVGTLRIQFIETATCLPVWQDFQVVEEAVYDGLFAASATGVPALGALEATGQSIKAKTDNLPAAPASTTNITAGVITTVTNLTNAPTVGDLTAAMKASVNAEVVDGLNVDTYAEPAQGAPAATATLVAKIGFLYKAFRNRATQTATAYKLYNDDAVTVDQKATVSDDGTTFDSGEKASGP